MALTQTHSSDTDCMEYAKHSEPDGTRPPEMPAVHSGTALAKNGPAATAAD